MLARLTRAPVITRRSLHAALWGQGIEEEEAFDLGTIDALLNPDTAVDTLLNPDTAVDFSGSSTLQLWLPGFHALLPTVSDADFSPVFMEYSKDVLDPFGYALDDADLRIRADRLLPDLQTHLKSLTDTILAVLYDKLIHGEAYISRQNKVDMPPQEIVKNLSNLFGVPSNDDSTVTPETFAKHVVIYTAKELFNALAGKASADPKSTDREPSALEKKIRALGKKKKLEQIFGHNGNEANLDEAYNHFLNAAIIYGNNTAATRQQLDDEILYLGLMEFFGNRDGITEEQREKDLRGKIISEIEGCTRYRHDYRLTIEADLHLTRRFRLKNPFAHGGKIYLNKEKGLVVIHVYSSCEDGINLTAALKEGREYLILGRIGQYRNSSILSYAAHAAAQGELQELLENWTFACRLVPTGLTGYARNSYGVARFLLDKKFQQN